MEYIINHQLRRVAYLKFLLFFVAAIITILVAAYFTVSLPTKENAGLWDKVNAYANRENGQQPILNAAQNAANLIDSMSQPGQNIQLLEREIARYLDTIRIVSSDSNSIYAATNKVLFNMVRDYHELKKNIINLKDAEQQQAEKFKIELESCQGKLSNAKDRLEVYKDNNYPQGP